MFFAHPLAYRSNIKMLTKTKNLQFSNLNFARSEYTKSKANTVKYNEKKKKKKESQKKERETKKGKIKVRIVKSQLNFHFNLKRDPFTSFRFCQKFIFMQCSFDGSCNRIKLYFWPSFILYANVYMRLCLNVILLFGSVDFCLPLTKARQ